MFPDVNPVIFFNQKSNLLINIILINIYIIESNTIIIIIKINTQIIINKTVSLKHFA